MNQTSNQTFDRIGATPGKLALVAILSVVLLASAMTNFGVLDRDDDSNNDVPAAQLNPSKDEPSSSVTRRIALSQTAAMVDWPEISLEDAARYDPFAKPEFLKPTPPPMAEPAEPELPVQTVESQKTTAPQSTPEELALAAAKRLDEQTRAHALSLKEQGVAVIVQTSGGNVAQIGDRTVAVGDTIDGLQIISITPDGIVVKPAETKIAAEDADD